MAKERITAIAGATTQVMLKSLTTLRVGGPVGAFVEARTDQELIDAVAECDSRGEPVLIIGGGSNIVAGDAGFAGTVIKVATRGVQATRRSDDVLVRVAAGESWDRFVAQVVADGWAGVEALSGIPGSVGATPIQNVGAYGREVADVIERLVLFDRSTRSTIELGASECGFGYRTSRFKQEPGRWVVLAVVVRLHSGGASEPINYPDLVARLGVVPGESIWPIKVRRAVLAIRRSKGMVLDIEDHDTWSVGSFFTNPIVSAEFAATLPSACPAWEVGHGAIKLSAAWLIQEAGFAKGFPCGADAPVTLSSKHVLALTNRGNATAADVLALARTVRDQVRRVTGVTLEPEPTFINLGQF